MSPSVADLLIWHSISTPNPRYFLLGKLRNTAAPAVALALLVELASEAVVRGPADDALLVEGRDDAVRLLLDEGDTIAVVREVYESPLELLTAILLLKSTMDTPDELAPEKNGFSYPRKLGGRKQHFPEHLPNQDFGI